jgi:hypothetical protein
MLSPDGDKEDPENIEPEISGDEPKYPEVEY